eukprot:TRINITY_DN1400_c0_g2_i1.p2 TRINITY_DN1400_c0_g2~~TRINITY_DN1400_c0_g2_i1.p2  ORF type:complete len:106 (+),score=8.47 TRINITY_DN1400_c0_g2_i1:305-622(+)
MTLSQSLLSLWCPGDTICIDIPFISHQPLKYVLLNHGLESETILVGIQYLQTNDPAARLLMRPNINHEEDDLSINVDVINTNHLQELLAFVWVVQSYVPDIFNHI